MDRKKLWELIGSVFIAVIFLTSYAAFGGGSAASNATTTAPVSQTVYATAQGAASISSYGPVLNINVSCTNATSVSSRLNSLLTSLEKNNSVSTFYSPQNSQIFVQIGTAGAYGVYKYLYQSMGQGSLCTTFLGQANVQLPSKMTFYVPTQRTSAIIIIPAKLQGASLQVRMAPNVTNTVNVVVSTLITLNGSIYGNLSVRTS